MVMETKKALKARIASLTHEIQNIRRDYSEVSTEDMPQELLDEMADLLVQLYRARAMVEDND